MVSIAGTQHSLLIHSPVPWTLGMLPCLGYCGSEHFYTVTFVDTGLHFFGIKEWDCWVREEVYFNFMGKLPNCFSKVVVPFFILSSIVWAFPWLYILSKPHCEAISFFKTFAYFYKFAILFLSWKSSLYTLNRISSSEICFGNMFYWFIFENTICWP